MVALLGSSRSQRSPTHLMTHASDALAEDYGSVQATTTRSLHAWCHGLNASQPTAYHSKLSISWLRHAHDPFVAHSEFARRYFPQMFEKCVEGEVTIAIDIFSNLIELRDGGTVDARPRDVSGDWGLWTMAAFHADSNRAVHSDVWERHPLGDELLCLLSGSITVHLRNHAERHSTTMELRPGTCCVVPAGHWHRLTVDDPGDLLAITPRVNTAYEAVPST